MVIGQILEDSVNNGTNSEHHPELAVPFTSCKLGLSFYGNLVNSNIPGSMAFLASRFPSGIVEMLHN